MLCFILNIDWKINNFKANYNIQSKSRDIKAILDERVAREASPSDTVPVVDTAEVVVEVPATVPVVIDGE